MKKIFKVLLLIMIGAAIVMPSEAKKKKSEKEEILTVYVFGVSQNLGDSTVYLSAITPVAGAKLLSHNVLENRIYYTEQFKKYIEETFNLTHQTAAVIYNKDRKKVEKKYAKTQAKINKHTFGKVTFKNVSQENFHFKVPVIVNSEEF